jgi:Zn-finger nucleic acid-binding protein
MKCPNCPTEALVMADRQGVEIDYCPNCRGVWLDRGELDKLLERSAAQDPRRPPAAESRLRRPDFVDSDHHGPVGPYPHGHRRRKSWLSEIFD